MKRIRSSSKKISKKGTEVERIALFKAQSKMAMIIWCFGDEKDVLN